jgi:hypothetical protein
MDSISLSEKSRAILEAIAAGHSYEQILVQDLAWTYQDIFCAVREALAVLKSAGGVSYEVRLDLIRQAHPRAYDKWSDEEDDRLRRLVGVQTPVKEIARILQRQPSAIRSRLVKLGMVGGAGAGTQAQVSEPSPDRRESGTLPADLA